MLLQNPINMIAVPFERSFASHEKSKFWSKNNKLSPHRVFNSSRDKYLFDCDKCNHSFEKRLNAVTYKNEWCPYCTCKKICLDETCNACFANSFASHPRAVCWSTKNESPPRHVFLNSNAKHWFTCDACNHDFQTSLGHINTTNRWCPYCTNKVLCNNTECIGCFEKSFASNPKSKCWSVKNKLMPTQVFRNSSNKYLFECNKCDHGFEQRLDHITGSNAWCAYCANQKLCNNPECACCFEKSFASNPKSKYWSKKNELTPRQVFCRGSSKKYMFNCDVCNHEFERPVGVIKDGIFCNYCSIPTSIICENEKCEFCFEKSFASHEKSKFWSKKNELTPRQVLKMSGKKYWFSCNKCNNEFETALYSISSGCWCPYCLNKTEAKLHETIKLFYSTILTQFKQPWCKSKTTTRFLRYDFCIPDLKIIIELDGPQHFRQISNWSTPEEQFENDKYKERCANENGYSVIRILQEDVLLDNYDWVKELCDAIELVKTGGTPTNLYLCENFEYEHYEY